MLQWMLHLHENKRKAPLASLEMLSSELMPRFISHKGQVNTYRMRARGRTTEDEVTKARLANEQVKCLELRIRDKGMTIDEIRAWAVAEAKDGADIIFIDNLLCISDGGEKFDSKTVMQTDWHADRKNEQAHNQTASQPARQTDRLTDTDR